MGRFFLALSNKKSPFLQGLLMFLLGFLDASGGLA